MKLFRKKFIKEETKRLTNSFKYAFRGIISSFTSEKNMQIHVLMLILVIIFGFILRISYYEWLICLILFAMVLAAELFNTAIEVVVDIVMPYKDIRAKLAKDISAGAVLVIAFFAAFFASVKWL